MIFDRDNFASKCRDGRADGRAGIAARLDRHRRDRDDGGRAARSGGYRRRRECSWSPRRRHIARWKLVRRGGRCAARVRVLAEQGVVDVRAARETKAGGKRQRTEKARLRSWLCRQYRSEEHTSELQSP